MARPDLSIRQLLADGSVTSRAELAHHLGVSASTASAWVGQLIAEGVVVEDGILASQGGRPRRRLRLSQPPGHLLLVDLGGHHARVGIADLQGSISCAAVKEVAVSQGPDAVLETLRLMIEELPVEGPMLGVGLALPGPVQPDGSVRLPSRMPGWAGYPIRQAAMECFGAPVVVENDANAMALGEHRSQFGSRGHSITVKAGTAIGSGIIVDGQLYRGATSASGDVTHTRVEAAGPRPCTCGKLGCLETIASGAGIVARMQEQQVPVSSTADVLARCADGDPIATTMIRTAGSHLGEVLSPVVSFFNPDAVFLTGGLASSQHFISAVRARIYDGCHPLMTEALRIEAASLGADAGLHGMALLAAAGAEAAR
ncbi:ROK family transcriptional regulator [Arachnia propionica]|uniref:ROK family transcriptional regulator n=1 Tax=Arachnia propionica TaxID=1750 RepID=A0A3P1TCY3_9ACTN|nr:ROK family transcriptional regulator [Arachnia propionica]MDO5081905.1 ROK family transcriptional regulator [Arachnia propionica]RRD07244.1 ROK family transcriptional regulator [Arachnia propionica]